MEHRRLGTTDIEVSVVAMGCWALGNDPKFWGPVDDNESVAAIRQAIDLGLTLIDTAPAYGCGHSEEIVGKAITGRRDQVVVATKCGIVWDEVGAKRRCLTRDSVLAECEASLRRMRIETIDLYQVHWPDPATPIAETMEAMARLREQGKIGAVGVSNFSCEQMSEARRCGPIECLQPPLSMLRREATEALLPYCQEYGIGVIAYGPMAHGLLTGKFTESSTFTGFRASDSMFTGEAFERNLAAVDRLRAVADRLGCTVGQLALRWVIQQPGVTAAIAGAKYVSQVRENAAAGQIVIPQAEMDEIDAILAQRD